VDSVVDAYPLNSAHRGILFHSLQCELTDVYLSVISFRIHGALDKILLLQAWQQIFSHHPSLRSGVVVDGVEDPLWVVHESIEPDWEFLDFTALRTEQRDKKQRDAINNLSKTRFKFAAEALMKFTLIKLDDNTHQLLWAVHHLLSDGWSTTVVLEDVSTAYAANVLGVAPSLPPALEYGHFISSQSKIELNPIKQYWSDYLTNRVPTPLVLNESLRKQNQVAQGAIETRFYVDEKRCQAIVEAARRFETTSNVLLIGAWSFILRDFCQHEIPLFGVTSSGRSANLSHIDRGVGLYASTLPLFVDTTESHSLKKWLSDIGRTLQVHAENDALSLGDIQKLVERDGSEPLLSCVVALAGHENNPCFGTEEKDGIKIDSVDFQIHSHFDISLLIKSGERISLNLVSQTDKLDKASIDTIFNRYMALIDLLTDPTCTSVTDFRNRWNQLAQYSQDVEASSTHMPHQRIDDWILDVAGQHATCPALVQGPRKLTYADLVQRARQLCNALNQAVDGYDQPIALCMSDRIDAIVAMLGVLLSNRCYLPLDSEQPFERSVSLCQEANCALEIILMYQCH